MELTQVTDIFERINTMGKELNAFGLLIARLSNFAIDLRKAWDDTSRRYLKIKASDRLTDKLPIYILQAISLCYNKTSSCKRAISSVDSIYCSIQESCNCALALR